jgi:hypothetical protein
MTECQRFALATSDAAFRQMYLDIAGQWRELAEWEERLARDESANRSNADMIVQRR